ncbi:MAG TPA: AAA family ATPase [Candidatus Saccharimonadia bacterium]|nr:AAA family ATPase [Candidatus Saccharimonadia bacterium]
MNTLDIVLHASSQAQLDAFATTPAHAVLLSGPKGIGKTHVARTLGARLLGVPLDKLDRYAHYRIITAKNDAITIEQIRELISAFTLQVPGTAPIRRAAIIQDAEVMGTEAQNALLKLLEEPPTDSVLILTSSQPAQLLATIRSRVQQLQLPAPTAADIVQHFVAIGHSEATIKAALLRSGTNIAEVQQTLNTSNEKPDTTISLVKQVLGASPYERLLLVDALAKQKDQARLFTNMLAVVATASLEAAALKGATTLARWRDILQAAYTAQNALEQSGNAKLVLTELMLAL